MNTALPLKRQDAGIDADTGEYIVACRLHEKCTKHALENYRSTGALELTPFAQIGADRDFSAIPAGTAIHFEKLGLVLCGTSQKMAADSKLFSSIAKVPTGSRLRALPKPKPAPASGPTLVPGAVVLSVADSTSPAAEDPQWGLRTIGALDSKFTGKGVRVCVIDTGLNIFHDDLKKVDAAHRRSFVGDSTVMSEQSGHGTRSAGIVGGAHQPFRGLRYSVAPDAELFVAKVWGDRGITVEALISALGWAVENNCAIVSMSIGDESPTTVLSSEPMELAAAAALAAGTLIVAGAGNDSVRSVNIIQPVDHPANCKSIMAVGAVDQAMKVAPYSNAPTAAGKPKVDIAAPGTSRSASFPSPYETASGTSIATPFVAGVAALYAEAFPLVRGQALWDLLCAKAELFPGQKALDVGAGVVRAPGNDDAHLGAAVRA